MDELTVAARRPDTEGRAATEPSTTAGESPQDGSVIEFSVTAQVGTSSAVKYVENGCVLHLVLGRLLTDSE